MSGKNATQVLTTDADAIARAAAILREGGLVAVPTETVYGLAARADSAEAVAKIYRAKGRPDFNPLIVHVSGLDQARELAEVDIRAEQLVGAFWPGPLTMVLPLKQGAPIAPAVTAGLPTIALRCPAHPAMQHLLAETGLALAAPSANRSGTVSPTCAGHVLASLGGRIEGIVDGGQCVQGLESTIVALRPGGWQILRPGPVTETQIMQLLGEPLAAVPGRIEAPGQLAGHYSPGKPVRLDAGEAGADEFMIGFGPVAGDCNLAEDGDLAAAASRLYECLHVAASSEKGRIAVAQVPHEGIGEAINDRLRRAAAVED
jgi:L-threonylcarbamoyladenylate synthase